MAPSFSFQSRLDLACEPSAVRYARQHAQDTLRQWGIPADVLHDAVTIVAELASNAVRHAGADAEPFDSMRRRPQVGLCSLGLRISDHKLYISMFDESQQAPVVRPASADSEDGRGLQLVAGLSAGTWGFSYAPFLSGKHVWACLRLPVPRPPAGPEQARQSPAGRQSPDALGTATLPEAWYTAVGA